jgi:MraZ protein
MVAAASFKGFGLNAVDAKNRLLIPVGFRDVLAARGNGRAVTVGPGHADRQCLIAYDDAYEDELRTGFAARHGASIGPDAYRERTFLFGSTTTLTIDDAGRIVLPPGLKRPGGITGHVWFMGGADFFELWDPWTFMAQPDLVAGQRLQVEGELEARGLPLERPA